MRIISKFHDYYDGVQRSAQDRTVLYIRKERVEKCDKYDLPHVSYIDYNELVCSAVLIGFCGKLYPAVEVKEDPKKWESPTVWLYTFDALDNYLKKHLSAKERRWYTAFSWRKNDLRKFFEKAKEDKARYKEIFIEQRSPIFVIKGKWWEAKITWNAQLKPYQFMKIMDPYTAFQEIQMFMNNLANPEKEMPVISDELKIHTHGFNKWSFRRPPKGKK